MRKFATAIGHEDFSKDTFMLLLQVMDDQGMAPRTMDGYRCAWRFWELLEGAETPEASKEWIIEIVKGLGYNHGFQRRIPRGSIDLGRLAQVLEYCKEKKRGDLCDPLEVAFYAALRYSQLCAIRSGDAEIVGQGVVMLTLRKDKRINRNTYLTREVIHGKRIVSERLCTVLETLQKKVARDVLLFPKFDISTARLFIRTTAQEKKWPGGVYYDGVHCLRHGGTQRLDTSEHITEFIRDIMTQMTGTTRVNAYQRCWMLREVTDEERARATE